jgi:putative transposase
MVLLTSARAPPTLSTGESITGPKAHKALLSRLQRLCRSLARKAKGSENRKKAKARLAKMHARVGNIRKDALHQLTTDLTRRFHTIGIEDLNVRGMVKNRHLSRAVSEYGLLRVPSPVGLQSGTARGKDRRGWTLVSE